MNKEPLHKRTWFVVLWLILFFPVGLILMWVSKKWSTVTRSVVTVGILILFTVGAIINPDTSTTANADESKSEEKAEPVAAKADTESEKVKAAEEEKQKQEAEAKAAEEKAAEEKAAKEKEEQAAKEKAEPSLEETVTKVINKEAGKKTGDGEKRIIDLKIEDNAGGKGVTAEVRADMGWSEGTTVSGIQMDSSDIFKKLFKEKDVSVVTLNWYSILIDQYGAESEEVVHTLSLTRDTFEKINWDNFNRDNYPNIADDYYLHPALNK